MTELEALKAMADAAEYVLSYPGTYKLIVGHTPEQLKEAHGQVVDLIKRVEQAQSTPPMVQQMAEDALAEIGLGGGSGYRRRGGARIAARVRS